MPGTVNRRRWARSTVLGRPTGIPFALVTGIVSGVLDDDTLTGAGSDVTGTAAIALENDVGAIVGTHTVSGALTITLDDDTLTAAGSEVKGTVAVTLAEDVLTATGQFAIGGSLAVTLADDTLTAAGSSVRGTLTVTLEDDQLRAGAANVGTANIALADDTMAAAGGSTVGTLIGTLADDTIVAAGKAAAGNLTVTLADDVLLGSGTVTGVAIGTLNIVLADDTMLAYANAVTNIYLFEPPHDEQGPRKLSEHGRRRAGVSRKANDLVGRFGGPRSFSVLKINGVYQTIQSPSMDQVRAATEYYAGGHIHDVTQAQAMALTAAGYNVQGYP